MTTLTLNSTQLLDYDGFGSFNIHNHTSDEVEFRVRCKDCGISDMDIEKSCISCDCNWFQKKYNNDEEDNNE